MLNVIHVFLIEYTMLRNWHCLYMPVNVNSTVEKTVSRFLRLNPTATTTYLQQMQVPITGMSGPHLIHFLL